MFAAARACIDASAAAARVLVLPLALLLFLQWPLRDLVHAGSRQANDLAQVIFALYVAVAVSAATRGRAHLAADLVSARFTQGTRTRLARVASLLVLAPWCLFVLVSSAPMVWNAVRQVEAFGETLNPGYFLIKVAVALLAALLLLQASIDAFAPRPEHDDHDEAGA